MNSAISFLLPLAVTFVIALGLHLLAKERALRVGLLPLAVGLLGGWILIVRPSWAPVDDVRRVVHIGLGAALIGLAIDVVKPPRLITAVITVLYLIGCAFAAVGGSILPALPLSLHDGALVAALTVVAFLALARCDAMRERPLDLAILLTFVAGGLAVMTAIAQDAPLTALTVIVAATLGGFLLFVILTGAAVTDGAILVSGAPMLAVIWALAQRHPQMGLALLCLPLVLFAEPTARRVPLPAARISALLYPLILAGLVSLPLILAGLIAFVTTIP